MPKFATAIRALAFTVFLLPANGAVAGPNIGPPYADPSHPGAVLTLETDKAQYFLGENVLIRYTMFATT